MNKQLNNTTSGKIIKIDKIKESGIYYTIYENSIYLSQSKFGESKRVDTINEFLPLDKNLFPDTISINDMKQYQALLKIQEVETEYTISDDYRNWYITRGTDTEARIFIPNEAYDNALGDKNNITGKYYPLWQIISFGTENIDSMYSQITYNSIVLYVEELYPEHKAVLDMYAEDGVLVENKIVPVGPIGLGV